MTLVELLTVMVLPFVVLIVVLGGTSTVVLTARVVVVPGFNTCGVFVALPEFWELLLLPPPQAARNKTRETEIAQKSDFAAIIAFQPRSTRPLTALTAGCEHIINREWLTENRNYLWVS
jgi:hypothetical protein